MCDTQRPPATPQLAVAPFPGSDTGTRSHTHHAVTANVSAMRLFELHRDVDPSGISGIGVVAEAVEFRDGTVVVRWLTTKTAEPTTVIHPNLENVQALHGHGGSTRIVTVNR